MASTSSRAPSQDQTPSPPRQAFISHATADDGYVAELESFLRAAGLADVFNDAASIQPDDAFWPAIQQGIADSELIVCVISAASSASDWVRREVEHARNLGQRVIGLRIDDAPLPPHFAGVDVVNFSVGRAAEKRLDLSRILRYAPEDLVGRDAEKRLISDAWARALRAEAGRPQLLTFVALGGEGKTSLVAKWAVDELLAKGWPGCEAAFAWSFYSQGTRDQVAASSDAFLKAALDFFAQDDADRAFAASPAGAYEKGQRLARLVGSRRSLLILDGLEPLQYAPTAPTPGELKDQGIAALLKGLAQQSQGLCLATTRYSLPDLKAFRQSTAPEHELKRLSPDAGTHLLTTLGVKGTAPELQATVEEVQGHALTLQLLGSWLHDAHAGDIRQRHLVKLEEADVEEQGGHAFRVMAAYETSFEREGDSGRHALALLRLLGLFDRPVTADCFDALRQPLAITGLTDPLQGLSTPLLNKALSRLESARLLTVHREAGSNTLLSLDAHPLLREYFARQLREQQPDAWRALHGRLFEHLCASTKEGEQPTLEDLQPLYQAVAHGCLAGLQQRACGEVYVSRILKGMGTNGFYSTRALGAYGSDLGAVASFFDLHWHRVSPILSEDAQAWLFGQAAFRLRAMGRLTESIQPLRAGINAEMARSEWHNAALNFSNLSELELLLGEVQAATLDAEQAVTNADRHRKLPFRMLTRPAYADALHQAGLRDEAQTWFRAIEQMQQELEPMFPLLYSLRGFQYADLLLSASERAGWLTVILFQLPSTEDESTHCEELQAVGQRAAQTLGWMVSRMSLLAEALDHLTLARTALFTALLTTTESWAATLNQANCEADAAVAGLRRAGDQSHLPRGLLTRAWLRAITGPHTGPDSAQADLDEAWDIAERGPMRLHMADIHLYRARLFFREANYPWESPESDLAAARALIERCGYGRRREELADAEAALAQ
ncbi:MAG: TIR domain-containing protein [Burkholderiales bacterium]|nr:TIR domain-containing protein [Burkholderiales bacterium]